VHPAGATASQSARADAARVGQALAGGAESSDEDAAPDARGRSPTYVQEQEALRRGFLEVRAAF
jgi:hypothetical protein